MNFKPMSRPSYANADLLPCKLMIMTSRATNVRMGLQEVPKLEGVVTLIPFGREYSATGLVYFGTKSWKSL